MINASGESTPNPITQKPSNTSPIVPTKNQVENNTGNTTTAVSKLSNPTKNIIKINNEKADKVPGGSDGKDTTKLKKKFNLKMILGVVVLLLVVLGSGAGFFLSQQTQDLRQQAYDGGIPGCCNGDGDCPGIETCSVANGACPNNKSCKAPSSTIRSVCRNNACSQQVCVPGSGSSNCTDSTCSTNEECVNVNPPPSVAMCPDGSGPAVWCATFDCSVSGDVNNDGQCTSADGVSAQIRDYKNCTNPSTNCGQVDIYNAPVKGQNWGSFCGTTFHNMTDCGGGGSNPTPKTISGKIYCSLESPGAGWNGSLYNIENAPLHSIDSAGNKIANTISNGQGDYNMNIKPQEGNHFAVRVSNATGTAQNPAFRGTGTSVCSAKHESCEFASLPNNQANMNFETTVVPNNLNGTYDADDYLIITWDKATNYDGSKVENYILRLDYDDSQIDGVATDSWKPGTLADGGNPNDYWRYAPITVGSCTATTCTVDTRVFDTETGSYAKPWNPGKYSISITPVANSTNPQNGNIPVIELCREKKIVDFTPVVAPMCRDLAIYDVQSGNEIIDPVNGSSLYSGQVVQFQCAADNTETVDHYEFKITEPGGITEGAAINPGGTASRSLRYTIPSNGQFEAQCKVCTSATECQDYYTIN